uniref:Putative secreted protein n=1 Tax=Ixodes ricinus TaxID=34613 RepID=A0A6B0U5H4_IXORI
MLSQLLDLILRHCFPVLLFPEDIVVQAQHVRHGCSTVRSTKSQVFQATSIKETPHSATTEAPGVATTLNRFKFRFQA